MKQQRKKSSKITIGLDLGDRRHRFCVPDAAGEVKEEGTLGNDRNSLGKLSRRYCDALVVMEAGCHSPWISRYLEEEGGLRVLIANPRKLRAIYQSERKSDRRDAQMLARIGRLRSRFALSSASRQRRSATGSAAHQAARQFGARSGRADQLGAFHSKESGLHHSQSLQ